MLFSLIGNFDWPSALVVVGGFLAAALAYVAFVNRTPVRIQEMKLQNDRDQSAANRAFQHEIELKKLSQNLITSHRRDED